MDAERRPHPNCGIPPEEIDFMQNIILGKITSKYWYKLCSQAKPNYIEIVLFELRKIIMSAQRTIPLNEINRSDLSLKIR